jgi:seryl-tRNA synthetase
MLNLKPLYDAALAANQKMQGVLADMKTALDEGTEAGKQKALELRPALDQAKKEANEADQLYSSVRDALSASDNMAKKFVPVGKEENQNADQVKEMTRAAFMDLDAEGRMKFMKAGGKIVEAAAE